MGEKELIDSFKLKVRKIEIAVNGKRLSVYSIVLRNPYPNISFIGEENDVALLIEQDGNFRAKGGKLEEK